jgi:nucleotide-binding universal stress UspA family protein
MTGTDVAYGSVLVPTDGSAEAAAAARHAVVLAEMFDSEIHVLGVADERPESRVRAVLGAGDDRREELERAATETVSSVAEIVRDASIPCRTAVEYGVPHEEIRTYVDRNGISLVAMGTHGRSGLDRLLLGSVTERTVRTSDVPVLTVRQDPADGAAPDRVLIPTDGSDPAAVAVDHGIAIADRCDATVHALSVVDIGALASAYEVGPAVPDMIEEMQAECERAVDEIAERCDARGVDAVTAIRQGIPVQEIHDYTDEIDASLVAMGTHGRTGLERHLVGSVTERTIRMSDVPVLTVS